jgi:hypothetical protein
LVETLYLGLCGSQFLKNNRLTTLTFCDTLSTMKVSEAISRLEAMIEESGDSEMDWMDLRMRYGTVRIGGPDLKRVAGLTTGTT